MIMPRSYCIVAASFLLTALASRTTFGDQPAPKDRVLVKEVVVSATPEEVWRIWTTEEGLTSVLPPKARIELKEGGAYEWYFLPDAPEGQRGSEGCKIIAHVPQRMLAFTWNAPPSIPRLRDAGERTQVVLTIDSLDAERTRMRLTQHGFGEGEDWDKYHAYFDRAWEAVLNVLEKHFATKRTGDEFGRFVLIISPARPGFVTEPTREEIRLVGEHYQYVKGLFESGKVIFAGRAMDPPSFATGPADGVMLAVPACGIIVVKAAHTDEARKLLEADPAVKSGVFKGAVFAFAVAFDN